MNPFRSIALLLCIAFLAWGHASTAAEPNEPERIAALNKYLVSVKEQQWADALVPAQRLLELARQEGPQSVNLADSLTRVGGVQFAMRDYMGAEENFIAAIVMREKLEGPLDGGLEEPLRGLGYAMAATGRHVEAVQVLERALLVSQRSVGLFDLSQRGLRQTLGNSLSETGRGAEAEQQFRSILETAEKAYGVEDVRLVETLVMVGDWYARWGHFEVGRQFHRRAISIVEMKAGPVDARLIAPLRSLGRSYIREMLFANAGQVLVAADGTMARPLRRTKLPMEGQDAVERAISVMEISGRRNPAAYRSAVVDAGDWFLLKGDMNKALEYYRRVPKESGETSADAALSSPLSVPVMLDFAFPPVARRYLDRPADRTIERKLVIEFTVTRSGEVLEPRVVESDASERMERETLASIREALYRPRFENGEPVDTQNVRYEQKFRDLKN